jgi:transcriptional antiterminator RfaH
MEADESAADRDRSEKIRSMMFPSGQQWFVVSTKVRREYFAQEQLMFRGVETFLPRIIEPSRVRGKMAITPLFPGYLFLHIDLEQQYFDVVWTPGVRKFVAFGALPCPVDGQVVDFLHARTGAEGVLRLERVFHPGERVSIRSGPFEGLVGIIERPVCARGRVRVLMELLRRQTRVEVPEEIVERLPA